MHSNAERWNEEIQHDYAGGGDTWRLVGTHLEGGPPSRQKTALGGLGRIVIDGRFGKFFAS